MAIEQDVGQNFVRSWQKRYAPIVITVCFIPLLIDRYYDRLLQFFRQFLLIPNRNNKFMNRTANCHTPCFNQLCRSLQLRIYTHTHYMYNRALNTQHKTCVRTCTHTGSRCTPCVHGQATGLLRSTFRFILHLTTANHKSLYL